MSGSQEGAKRSVTESGSRQDRQPNSNVNIIRCSQSADATTVCWAVTITLIVGVPVAVKCTLIAIEEGEVGPLAGYLIPVFGLAWIVSAFKAWRRDSKFGRSEFRTSTSPGLIGGQLSGELALVGRLDGLKDLDVTLRCINIITVSGGDRGGRNRKTAWEATEHTTIPTIAFGQSEVLIPVAFSIPKSCRGVNDSRHRDEIEWELIVTAETPGVDLRLEFPVPIQRAEEGPMWEREIEEREVIRAEESPEPNTIRREYDRSGGVRLVCSYWPGPVGLVPLILAPIPLAIAAFALSKMSTGGPLWAPMPLVGLAAIPLVGVFLSWLRWVEVRIAGTAVDIRSRFIVFQRRHGVDATDVEKVIHEPYRSTKEFWAVYLTLKSGERIRLAAQMRNEATARWYVRCFTDALALLGGPRRPEATGGQS